MPQKHPSFAPELLRNSGSVRIRLLGGIALASILAASMLAVDPAQAEEPATDDGVDCAAVGDPGYVVDSEATALEAAQRCGRGVEVDALRDEAAKFTAEVDGTITAEVYASPQWTTDDAGAWIDIDPALAVDENGLITATAVPGDVTVSSGGDAQPFASLTTEAGETLDLWWPAPLPEPVLDGARARYSDVFDGVDLLVEASATGFAYQLEVATADAAANPELAQVEVTLGGTLEVTQDAASGVLTAADQSTGAAVLAASNALMWDSSTPASADIPAAGPTQLFAEALAEGDTGSEADPGDPGRVEEMDVLLEGETLSITPDAAMLADPATVFPVVIDPSFESTTNAWATVGNGQYADATWWDDAVFPRSGGLRMGFNGWTAAGEEGYGVWRSMIRFDLSKFSYADVTAATLSLTLKHTGGCGAYPLELWQTNAISKGATPTSWNSTAAKWLHGAALDTKTIASANASGGCSVVNPNREVTFASADLTHHVNRHANVPYTSITFGLKASDETDREQWVRSDTATAHLTVTYQPTMDFPSQLTVNGTSCLAPEGSRVSGTLPTLAAVPQSSDGEARMSFWIQDANGTEVAEHVSAGTVPSGTVYTWQTETALPEGVYRFQARANTTDSVTARYTTWCSFEVDATLDMVEEVSSKTLTCPYDTTGLDPAVDTLESKTEGGALLLAEACAIGVEVADFQDYDTQVIARPDGTLTAEATTVPAWAPDETGDWVDLDTGFTTAADGAITTAAAVSDITVSDGGTEPFVTAASPAGGTVSLTWKGGALPVPTVAGDTATYAEVLPGVDLQVSSGVDGFTYALIVKTSESVDSGALDTIPIGISSAGLTVAQDPATGEVTATDAAGDVVFSAPAAYMWDASLQPVAQEAFSATAEATETSPEDAVPGLYEPVGIALADGTLTVTPNAEMLANPDLQYPVTIDPPFVGTRQAWANLLDASPDRKWTSDKDWPREGGMRVGYNWWEGCAPDACGTWRSVIRFSLGDLKGKDLLSVKVGMTQTYSAGCGSTDLELWEVDRKFTSATTWNAIKGDISGELQNKSVASSNNTGSCGTKHPDRDVNFDNSTLRSAVQTNVNEGQSWMSFLVRSENEEDLHAWRRIDHKSVELQIVYNSPAKPPTKMLTNPHVGGGSCSASYAAATWTSEVRPIFSGYPQDPDGKAGAKIEVQAAGSSKVIRSWSTSRNQTSNRIQSWTVPQGKELGSGSYRWRMGSLDNYASGTDAWSTAWCHFRIDATPPTAPKIEALNTAVAGEVAKFKVTAGDSHSGISSYTYAVNNGPVQKATLAADGSGTFETTTPSTGDGIVLEVWAYDKAGGNRKTTTDFAAPRDIVTTPAAAWRLDGDGFDDVGGTVKVDGADTGLDLNIGRTSGWVDSDAENPPGQAMAFKGSDCASTLGPAVDTSARYSVAAWVRIRAADDGYHSIVSQSGEHFPGFALRYRGASDQWDFVLNPTDTADTDNLVRASATSTPAVGDWTHLAASVDPGSKVIYLWVNGVLEATRTFTHEAWNAIGAVNIGCATRTDSGSKTWHFNGDIQHVGIWNGMLSTADVQDVMAGALAAGQAGEWLMRGDAEDSSGQANALTSTGTGIDWGEDQWGRAESAVELDGSSCLTAGGAVQNRSDASFSTAAWVRPDKINTTSEQTIFGEGGGEYYRFKLRMWTDGKWGVSMGTGPTGTGTQNISASTAATVGKWVHLITVYDAVNSTVSLYIDGVLAASRTVTYVPWQGAGKLNIGCRGTLDGTSGNGGFDGAISQAQLWRGALTAGQIADVYGGNPGADLLGQWTLDGKSYADAEGGRTLTPTGNVEWGYDEAFNEDSCLTFTGDQYARTSGAVVRTDESFTVAAMVSMSSDKAGHQTILSQAGLERVGFNLNYFVDATGGRFIFSMPSADTAGGVTWHAFTTVDTYALNEWHHIAVVVDIPGDKIQLYVDAVPVAATQHAGAPNANPVTVPANPWNATGPFYIGAHGRLNHLPIQPMSGSVDQVMVWRSTVDPYQFLKFV